MTIERIHIRDFRNLEDVEIEPSPCLNVLHGSNGQGKTSFLEAVHFLSEGRSFRGSSPTVLLRKSAKAFSVVADVVDAVGTTHELKASWEAGQKALHTDGHLHTGLESYLGTVRVVVHSPEDSQLVLGPPEARRRFLNRILVLTRPGFFRDLSQYVRALRSRNRCLQEARTTAERESWTEVLVRLGSRILTARLELVEQIRPRLLEASRRIADQTGADPFLRYRTSDQPVEPGHVLDLAGAEALLRSQGERRAGLEQRYQRTLFGPHLDELDIELPTGSARRHASQGERRALLISLRLAERTIIAESTGEDPVFLVDDLSSELDTARSRRVLESVMDLPGQVFLTGTERRSGLKNARSFRVSGGAVDFDECRSDLISERLLSSALPAGRPLS